MRKSIVTVLAAVVFAGLVAPAAAETISITVPYEDLNLARPAGIATLEKRIKRATEQVCARAAPRNLVDAAVREECMVTTLANAREQMAAIVPPASVALAR